MDMFLPRRATVEEGRLVFKDGQDRFDALKDGCFALEIPATLDILPGKRLAASFYRDVTSDSRDEAGYGGYKQRPGVYFDRTHFQTEHILLDGAQRRALFPTDVNLMCAQMHDLARCVLRDMLMAMGIAPSLWSRATDGAVDGGGVEWFAVSHYRAERHKPGAPAHKDTGFVTVLFCEQPGLEAWIDGEWCDVAPLPGHFLINFGGALEVLTAHLTNKACAMLHRVRQCRVTAGNNDRYSFAAFLNPSAEGALYQMHGDGQSMTSIGSVEDFLREFNRDTWRDEHDEFGIAKSTDTGQGEAVPTPPVRAGHAPFPGVLAHHTARGAVTAIDGAGGGSGQPDHGEAFRAATLQHGQDASTYFSQCGIADLAEQNGGVCTFWLDGKLAIYQNTNTPLVNDADLAPSIDSNAALFGSFMGALSLTDPSRRAKRAVVENLLGNAKFIEGLDVHVLSHTDDYLDEVSGHQVDLDDFVMTLVARVDSRIPGVLDFNDKPLTAYLSCNVYGPIARDFFEIASEVISKVNTTSMNHSDLVVDMIRDMLEANYVSLSRAPATNIVKRQFTHWGKLFSMNAIRALTSSQLKELGTIIVAIYDTTSISLLWTIGYLETHPLEREKLQDAIENERDALDAALLPVLEALRLGGSNPTALWRRTIREIDVVHRGAPLTIPEGTMLWLDRRRANRDQAVFVNADQFDTRNITCLMKQARKNASKDAGKDAGKDERASPLSLLARNRYEINSFNMVNTHRSPRKCPGRLFSVRMQALMLVALYRRYHVDVWGISLGLAPFSTMPRPRSSGQIVIRPR